MAASISARRKTCGSVWLQHVGGKGASWTKQHPPVRVPYWEKQPSREAAVERENWLKTGYGRKWLKQEVAARTQTGDPVRAKAERRDPGLPKPLADLFPDSFEDSELGEIPKGWGIGKLGDLLAQRVERCVASPETAARPYVPIDCISSKSLFLTENKPGKEAQSSLTKFYKGELLFGAMRPYFHKVCIAPFDGTTRTTAFVLYPRQADDFAFATLLLHHPDTIDFATRHSTGSTIPYAVWGGSLEDMPVLVPPVHVRKAFNNVVRPILVRIPEPYFENRTLAALRDTLLPKLISGELRVKDAERFVGGRA